MSGLSPAMQENCRTRAPFCARPVPVRDKNQVVKMIRTAERFMAMLEGGADLMVVVARVRVVAPEIARSDRNRPGARLRHPVGPVETAYDSVRSAWRGSVSFAFAKGRAAAPDRTGKQTAEKAKPHGSENQIVARHAVESRDAAVELERARWSPGFGCRLRKRTNRESLAIRSGKACSRFSDWPVGACVAVTKRVTFPAAPTVPGPVVGALRSFRCAFRSRGGTFRSAWR